MILDTHALVWMIAGNERLGRRAREIADEALAAGRLSVSAISFWEIAMLQRKERLVLGQSPTALRAELLEAGLAEATVTGEIGILAASWPDLHPDPADRIIVATASVVGEPLLTADDRLLAWKGPARTVDARV